MLHEDKRHSVVSGKGMQKFSEGFQTASGRAHADDRKVVGRSGSRRGWASIGFAAVRRDSARLWFLRTFADGFLAILLG